MRHAEFSTSIPALAPTAATAPTAPAGNGGGNFRGVYGQLQSEVADFIQNGDGGFSSAANLSAEGSVYRARSSEAAAANGIIGDDGASDDQQAFLASIAPCAKAAPDK